MEVTRDDLLRVLEESRVQVEQQDNVFTRQDIQDFMGVSEKTAIVRIRRWIKAGVLKPTKVYRESVAGYRTLVPAYEVLFSDGD